MWTNHTNYYSKVLMSKENYHNQVEEQVWNKGSQDLMINHYICGYYIVDGEVTFYDETYTKDTLIWIIAGSHFNIVSKDNTHVIYIETEKELEDTHLKYEIYKDSDIAWSKNLDDGMTASKHMIKAEDYGVKIQTCIYTTNFDHAWHSHKYAHGFYVLNGMLQYDFADGRKGIYGPGEFVVSDSDEEVLHQTAPNSSYCKYLFIGDGLFDFIVNGVDMYKKK